MLNQEDKKIDNLIKEIKDLIKNLNKEDKSLRDQALEKKVNEDFEILYEEEDFENRAKSIREKVREDFIGEVLPKINAQTSKIKISISIVIQENIDKWSRLLERCSFKNSIFKLEGDEGLCSQISSFLNHDDLKSFLNTIPPGTIPTLMSIEEDGEISPKRLKECIPEYDTELSVAGELPDLNFVQITEKFIKA